MNMNKSFLLIMLAGVCSVANAADNSHIIRIHSLNQDSESGVFFVGKDVAVRLSGDNTNDPTNIEVWINLCLKLYRSLSSGISLYDANGNKLDYYCGEDEDELPYDPDNTYFAHSRRPHIEIADINGLNIKGGDE